MRPLRLELEGFTAFRDPVAVDFEGMELFALVGATGSGKTALLDAMCFALYGNVPRLGRRDVEPVITGGRNSARVRFDFSVGQRRYTAVRVVRRLRDGYATTKEARLESGGESLAGDPGALTREVEALLGLGFEQFTKCVVLPQGEFARFLHDKPAQRQELLVRLLELGVYDRMRDAARQRKQAADARIDLIGERLDRLADATDDALAEATDRTDRLLQLRQVIDGAQPTLDDLAEAERRLLGERDARAEEAAALEALRAPDDVDDLAALVDLAQRHAADASAAAQDAEQAVAQAIDRLGALPDRSGLERLQDAHRRHGDLQARIAKAAPILEQAQAARERAEDVRRAAVGDAAAAEERLTHLRREHAAHALAAQLAPGRACPVCAQTVATLPARSTPEALSVAEAAAKRAGSERASAEEALRDKATEVATAEETMRSLREQQKEIQTHLQDAPEAEQVARLLAEVASMEAQLATAQQRERAARDAQRSAQTDLDVARERQNDAWTSFHAARDPLTPLGAPSADRADLGGSWKALLAWAQREAADRRSAAQACGADAAERRRQRETLAAELLARCAECDVHVAAGQRPRDACADALAAAAAARERLANDVREAAVLRAELGGLRERGEVADLLARHLRADGFERWLLNEALQRLATGASLALRELSSGQYSLAIDAAREFVVIDHRNLDQRRSTRTLSGGETFLTSLALALTLAEQLAELSVISSPRLESIFLDEGFGTLDPETLDVVAATVEELGARGRTVGLVTHVRELAERMPVRYEVRKTTTGASVERVTA